MKKHDEQEVPAQSRGQGTGASRRDRRCIGAGEGERADDASSGQARMSAPCGELKPFPSPVLEKLRHVRRRC